MTCITLRTMSDYLNNTYNDQGSLFIKYKMAPK